MTVSLTLSTIGRLHREIGSLRDQDAREARKASDAQGKLCKIASEMGRASPPRASGLSQDSNRQNKLMTDAITQRARIAERLAQKHRDLNRYEQQLQREQERENRRVAERDRKETTSRERRLSDLEKRLTARHAVTATEAIGALGHSQDVLDHDLFICHASEDKDEIVRDLASLLAAKGAKVWYDEFSLKVGDSLRRGIDRGLSSSRFGLVILSPSFFAKRWPQHELDGLVQLEMAGQSRVLPIWHKVSVDEVRQFSPTLADKVALNTSIMSIDQIANELELVLR